MHFGFITHHTNRLARMSTQLCRPCGSLMGQSNGGLCRRGGSAIECCSLCLRFCPIPANTIVGNGFAIFCPIPIDIVGLRLSHREALGSFLCLEQKTCSIPAPTSQPVALGRPTCVSNVITSPLWTKGSPQNHGLLLSPQRFPLYLSCLLLPGSPHR